LLSLLPPFYLADVNNHLTITFLANLHPSNKHQLSRYRLLPISGAGNAHAQLLVGRLAQGYL